MFAQNFNLDNYKDWQEMLFLSGSVFISEVISLKYFLSFLSTIGSFCTIRNCQSSSTREEANSNPQLFAQKRAHGDSQECE